MWFYRGQRPSNIYIVKRRCDQRLFTKISRIVLAGLILSQNALYPLISALPAPPPVSAQESPPDLSAQTEATDSAQTPAPSQLDIPLIDLNSPTTPNSAQIQAPETNPETTPESFLFNLSLRYPFSGEYPVTYHFGERSDDEHVAELQSEYQVIGHEGIDFALPLGTEVQVVDAGVVEAAGPGDYGQTVVVRHAWGTSYYGHLSKILVNPGDLIGRSHVLARAGNTGNTTGPHLHFGIKPKNAHLGNGYHGMVDPAPYFYRPAILGVMDSQNKPNFTPERKVRRSKFRLAQKSLAGTEDELKLTLNQAEARELNVTLTDPKGKMQDISDLVLGDDGIAQNPNLTVPLDKETMHMGGKYTLTVTDESGYYDQQDFTWGVLAINPNKSVYKPGDLALIAMAVLDERGEMVCDASVTLRITSPHGKMTTLTTATDTILVNQEVCESQEYTLDPDYSASYPTDKEGIYKLSLTATTRNGTYSIQDQFQVDSAAPFDVARESATRLYPLYTYPMTIRITPTIDFRGTVIEHVDTAVTPRADTRWQVDWVAGNSYSLTYNYDVPDISPEFYHLGGLEFVSENGVKLYEQPRPWQLASDAITYQSAGSVAYSTDSASTISPIYPGSIANGNLLVLLIGMKPRTANGGSVITPNGWTPLASLTGAGGYGTTLGADTGNTNIFSYYMTADGSEGGTFPVTLTDSNVAWAQIYRLSGGTGNWSLSATTGSDTSAGNVSITFDTDPGVTAGDHILAAMVIPTDVTTPTQFSAEALSQTGVTFGTVTEISEPDSGNGNDIGGFVVEAPVSSGTGSAAPVLTATAGGTTTDVRGPGIFIRIREGAVTPTPYSFQRKTWYDGTRYWRSYYDQADGRLEFEYSSNGTSWTENTSARITANRADFSVEADSGNAFVVYSADAIPNMDNQVTSGLQGYWKMDESSWNGTSNEVVDASGNANHGVRVGNATTTTGKFNNGGTFDDAGDYVSVANATTLEITGDLTISAWVKRSSTTAQDTIVDLAANGETEDTNHLYHFYFDSSGFLNLIWEYGAGSNQTTQSSVAVATPVGNWLHVTVTRNVTTNQVKYYENGFQLGATQSFTNDPTGGTSAPLIIGAAGSTLGDWPFHGLLDDVRIYNRTLTTTEIDLLGRPGDDNILGRKASSYPGTGFAWGSEQVVLDGSGSYKKYSYPVITRDSSSYVHVAARQDDSRRYYMQTIKEAGGTNDLPEDSADTVKSLGNLSNTNPHVYGVLSPLTSQNMYLTFAMGTTLAGCKWVNASTAWQDSSGNSCEDNPDMYSGLQGWWELEEAGDTDRVDSSGNSNSLTESASDTVAQVTGKFGNGADFERGDTEYLEITDAAQTGLDLGVNFSLSAWLNVESTVGGGGAHQGVITRANVNGAWSYAMRTEDSAICGMIDNDGFAGGGSEPCSANSMFSTATWTLFTMTYDGTTMRLYKNGSEQTSGTWPLSTTLTPLNSTGTLELGRWGSQSGYYDGIIDDARVYNRTLTGSEISALNSYNPATSGSYDTIDTSFANLQDTFSAVGDGSGNVYLIYIDDEATDQVSAKKWNGTSWGSAALVADAADGNDSYPTLTLDTTASKLYAFWLDTSSSDIYYSSCDISTNCDLASEWAAETSWQTTGTNTYVSSNYSGANKVFAQWYDGTAIDWDLIVLNTAPDSPTSLAQKTTADVTLATGDWHNTTSIKFTATATDTDNPDTLQLCVEKDLLGTSFSNTEDSCGTGVSYSGTGVSVSVTISSQTDASEYHWQARIKDAGGLYSAWVAYGGNAESARDYGIDTTAPTGGTVYDGTGVGVDSAYNDGSLSSLSANWDSFNSNVSGLNKYQYSIGTTAGATDVRNWTDNSTTTSVTATGLTLQTSQMYYVNVRAVDMAGNTGNAVSSNGQRVAPSLNFTVSPGTLTFGNLNSGNSYTDSQATTLTSSTNAYNGYVVRAFVTDYLRSTTGNFTIPDFTGGTYAAPAAWGSSTGLGYTSSDTTIQGSNLFSSGTLYAPFSHTGPGDIVADHTSTVTGTPITNEQFTITYKVAASNTQPAHKYTSTVVYTITAQY